MPRKSASLKDWTEAHREYERTKDPKDRARQWKLMEKLSPRDRQKAYDKEVTSRFDEGENRRRRLKEMGVEWRRKDVR